MSIEEAIQGGIVFKGKKDKPKDCLLYTSDAADD